MNKHPYLNWLMHDLYNDKYYGVMFKDYSKLFLKLLNYPFEVYVDKDNNRVDEVMLLRNEYKRKIPIEHVSILEIMLVLAKRMCDNSDNKITLCFMELLKNINFDRYNNEQIENDPWANSIIKDSCHIIVNRTYNRDGVGGFFPIPRFIHDLRKVELWYQMCYYLRSK